LCDELYEDEDNTNVHDGDDDDEVAVEPCDVLVLGAGAAGIAAARALTKLGVKTVVVEGRSRVGGRAHTSDELGVQSGFMELVPKIELFSYCKKKKQQKRQQRQGCS